MGRVFKILMYLVLLLLVYLWFSTIFKSCGKGQQATANIENVDDASLDDLDALDEEDMDSDEFFEEEDDIDYEELDADIDTEDEDIYDEDIDYTSNEATTAPVEESKPVQTSKPVPSSSSSGKYMVIAGSYLIKSNAENMVNKLTKLGYDAEVVIFDLSEYHSVSAGKFRSYEDAQSASRKLSGRGIDSYVHTRK